jgi:hypothetical protein
MGAKAVVGTAKMPSWAPRRARRPTRRAPGGASHPTRAPRPPPRPQARSPATTRALINPPRR